ncbi:YlbG family protein [Radiobacillus sp. PE A8.2]|uniref:YlbG family protein n=1 Tax=Radiobacillus sp. PE A8.2 TaxID=3380349 RepID=UPI00388ED71E
MRVKRQGLVVWFQHMKNVKQIRRYGHVIYVAKDARYAVLYVNQDEVEDKQLRLRKLPFVSKVEESYKPFVRTNFENAKADRAKEYDYKMGI